MVKVKKIPEEIVQQAHHILNNRSYSRQFRREVIRQLLGKCSKCGEIPNRFVIEKRDGVEIITRFCELH